MTAPSSPNSSADKADIAARQRVMRVLAQAPDQKLEDLYDKFADKPDWTFARKPETGLVMTRGRIGGGGAPFNLGEITVTRAAIQLPSGEVGHAYCQGRNQRKAAIAAFFDAAWLSDTFRQHVERDIIAPLEQEQLSAKKDKLKKAAATKVDFFTMVRGDG